MDKPPNHHLFDPVPVTRSPVLQRRLDNAYKASNTPALLPAPNMNSIQFTDSTIDLLHSILRPAVPEPPVPVATVQAMPMVTTLPVSSMLLNPNRDMGQDMSIAEFCKSFGLQQSVLEKLKENAYDHARHL